MCYILIKDNPYEKVKECKAGSPMVYIGLCLRKVRFAHPILHPHIIKILILGFCSYDVSFMVAIGWPKVEKRKEFKITTFQLLQDRHKWTVISKAIMSALNIRESNALGVRSFGECPGAWVAM